MKTRERFVPSHPLETVRFDRELEAFSVFLRYRSAELYYTKNLKNILWCNGFRANFMGFKEPISFCFLFRLFLFQQLQ